MKSSDVVQKAGFWASGRDMGTCSEVQLGPARMGTVPKEGTVPSRQILRLRVTWVTEQGKELLRASEIACKTIQVLGGSHFYLTDHHHHAAALQLSGDEARSWWLLGWVDIRWRRAETCSASTTLEDIFDIDMNILVSQPQHQTQAAKG